MTDILLTIWSLGAVLVLALLSRGAYLNGDRVGDYALKVLIVCVLWPITVPLLVWRLIKHEAQRSQP